MSVFFHFLRGTDVEVFQENPKSNNKTISKNLKECQRMLYILNTRGQQRTKKNKCVREHLCKFQ